MWVWRMVDFDCTACNLCLTRTNIVMGEGCEDPDILILGEAPGKHEDLCGRPFVGDAGRVLNELLSVAKFNRSVAYVTNAVKCRPPENRNPIQSEIVACRYLLTKELQDLKPRIIITLGRIALKALLKVDLSIEKARSKIWIDPSIDRRIFPTYHPAATLYNKKIRPSLFEDFERIGRFYRETQVQNP